MSDKEVDELVVRLEKYRIKITKSKKKSKQFLVDTGIIKANGKLTKHYKHLYIPLEQA